jgi:hypothetical protein
MSAAPPGDWNVPRPPPDALPRRPIRGRRVPVGIGIALAAHLLTIVAMLVSMAIDTTEVDAATGFFVLLVAQGVVLIGCLAVGIVLAARNEGGVGVGLLIGWAIGVIVAPVVGSGVCIWANSSGL